MEQLLDATKQHKFKSILQLTRWRHHVPFVIPLTILGAMMAVQRNELTLDWRLLAIIVANVLTMSSAFIINDIEDAPDDACDPHKREQNVISSGLVDVDTGKMAFWGICAVSFVLYAMSGFWALLWGTIAMFVAYMYSVKPVRLKSRPVVDVVSHALGAGSLLVVIGHFLYSANPGPGWYVIIGITLGSAYGQFYNQLEDFELDRKAGLDNTTQRIGKRNATVLMFLCLIFTVVCIVMAIIKNVFPDWLATVAIVGMIACSMFVWKTDMRGNEAGVHALQIPILLIFNVTAMLWLASALGLMAGVA